MALADKARGQRIAALRLRTPGLTQQAVAQKLGIGYRTIQSWEAGEVVPEWPNVERLAKYYKVRPEEIMGELPPMRPAQLDRIEAKLDELLAILRPGTSPGDVAETAAARIEATPPEAAPAPKRPRRSKPAA